MQKSRFAIRICQGLLIVPGLFGAALVAADNFDQQINTLVEKYSAPAIEDRHQIHQNPELSNHEVKTAARVAKHLRALGIDVKTGIAHTGVVGVLHGKKPGGIIALRFDMDALPIKEESDLPFRSTVRSTYMGHEVPVAHACGHDVHVAAGLGVASVLASLREQIPGTVMFIFQPAEEGVPPGERGGAKLMVEEGIFKEMKPDAVIAFHTNGKPPEEEGDGEKLGNVTYTIGPAFAAATKFMATVHGRPAHGSTPHLSVDPIVVGAEIVTTLQTIRSRVLSPLAPSVITVGVFRGGERNNIIPADVYMEGTIRTFDNAVLDTIEQRMRDIFEGVTHASHATFDLSFDRSHPMLVNDAALAARLLPTLDRVGGAGKVSVRPPDTGAEDFSYFSNIVPGFYFYIGVVPEGRVSGGHHTPTFYADDAAVPIAMRIMSSLAVDYLGGN